MKYLSQSIRLLIILISLFGLLYKFLSQSNSSNNSLESSHSLQHADQLISEKIQSHTLSSNNKVYTATIELLSNVKKLQSTITSYLSAKAVLLPHVPDDAENVVEYQMLNRRTEISTSKGNGRYLKLVETSLDLGLDASILSFKSSKAKRLNTKQPINGATNAENILTTKESKNISETLSYESMSANKTNVLANIVIHTSAVERNITTVESTNSIQSNISTDQKNIMNLEVEQNTLVADSMSTVRRIVEEEEDILMGVDENNNPVQMRTASAASRVSKSNGNAITQKGTSSSGRVDVKKSSETLGANQGTISSFKTIEYTNTSADAGTHNSSVDVDVEGKLFYMYDLDEEFWWRWPHPDADCSENGYMTHTHAELSGMGPPILPDEGLFLTWHFSLFSSLFNRMKRSKRRTFDPEKASLFIIPYDLGLDGYLDSRTCKNSRRCTRGHPEKVQEFVRTMPYFDRHQGRDHAVLWSLGQYHPWPSNGCDLFMRNFCEKCTFTCYWMDPTKADNRFVSIPFPSGYHWWDGIKELPWEVGSNSNPESADSRVESANDQGSSAEQRGQGRSVGGGGGGDLRLNSSMRSNSYIRNLTAVYLGSTQTLNPAHTKIRRAMTAQCNVSSECHWKQIAHSSTDSTIADLLSTYRRSIFCLCPPGDDPARKAVFDSILSGCIPVIFEVATLYNQYPWHLGEEASLDISVNIPGGLVRSGKLNFMDVLNSIPPETIRLKQIAIAKYAPHIQYAMPPLELLKNRSDITPWDPPFKDGVDFTLDGLFVRTSHAVNNQSTGIPHRLMTSREWSKEYDVVKVKTPGMTLVPFVLTRVIPGIDVQGQKGHKKGHKKHLKNDGAQIQGKKETKMGSNS